MRTAQTILTVIQERGKRKLLLERVYKMLFNRELYLAAYAKLYSNSGAMTKGVTNETVYSISISKIDNIIAALGEFVYMFAFKSYRGGANLCQVLLFTWFTVKNDFCAGKR